MSSQVDACVRREGDPQTIGEGGGFQMKSKFDLPFELQETPIIHNKEFALTHKKRMKSG